MVEIDIRLFVCLAMLSSGGVMVGLAELRQWAKAIMNWIRDQWRIVPMPTSRQEYRNMIASPYEQVRIVRPDPFEHCYRPG